MAILCPCHSKSPYAECCEPFHTQQHIPNPVQLMRSRYAAYALGLADYIMQTTHRSHPEKKQNKFTWKKQIELFSKTTDFAGLTILNHSIHFDRAFVSFKADLIQDNQPTVLAEKSLFILEQSRWFYAKLVN